MKVRVFAVKQILVGPTVCSSNYMTEILSLEAVGKTVQSGMRGITILQDITLHIESEEYLSLTGPSGSGKSTLLNLIGLLDRPSSGQLKIGNQPVDALSPTEMARLRGQFIGFVFQSFHLIPHLT